MKPAQLLQFVFIAVAAFFVYAFVATAKDGETRRSCTALCALAPNYAGRSRRAPEFELPNLAGKKVRLSDYRGKTVILNFWSKTCPPCLEEMPSLAILGHALAKRTDVVLVTITNDESAEDAKATLHSVLGGDIPFEVLVDSENLIVGDKFGTKLFPETWFIDPRGIVRARIDGARDWSSPLALQLAESFSAPLTCGVTFRDAKPDGPDAAVCGPLD